MDRGRQDRTGEFEPGSLTVLLDNAGNDFDPQVSGSYTDLAGTGGLPWRPVRLTYTADVDGSPQIATFIFYTGPECWAVKRKGRQSTAELVAVDTMGLFESIENPSSPMAATIRYHAPDWWIRGLGGDLAAGNGDSLQDSSGNDYASLIASSGGGVLFATDSLVPDEDNAAMLHQANTSGYTDEATLTAATSAFRMSCVWESDTVSGTDQEIIRQRTSPGGVIRWRLECNTSGSLVLTVYNTSGVAQAFTAAPSNPDDGGGRWDDGSPHLLVVSFQGGSLLRIEADGQTATQTSSIPATVNGRVIFGGGAAVAKIDEVAYWSTAPYSATVSGDLLDAFTGDGIWGTDGPESRIERLWELANEPGDPDGTGPFEFHEGTADSLLGATTDLGATLADTIRGVAESYRGAGYALRDGTVRFRTYTALARAAYEATYVDPVAHLTDETAPTSLPRVVRRSEPQWSGVRVDRIVNVSEARWSGLTFELRDQASIDKYGRRVRRWTSEVEDALYASWLAAEDVDRYADPLIELRSVTLSPLVDAEAAAFLASDCELEAPIQFTYTPPGESAITVGMNVQGESWSWENGVEWTVTLSLAPDVASDVALSPPAFGDPEAIWWAGTLERLETDADDDVQQWPSFVGNLDVSQATFASRPLYRASSIGGRPAVEFDGSDDYLGRSAPFTGTQGAVVAVIASDAFTPPQVGTVWAGSSSTETTEYLAGFDHNSDGSRAPSINRYASGGGDEVEGASSSSTSAVIVEWSSDGDDWTLRTDNALESLTVVDGSNSGDWFGDLTNDDLFTLGATRYENSGAQVASYLDGRIAFLAVYPAPLTTTERAELYGWLEAHYGL